MKINIIAACDNNGVIGINGKIPFDIPEDRKRFKKLTTGHAVIMGRKTKESLPVFPLKSRLNIVVSEMILECQEFVKTYFVTHLLAHAIKLCLSVKKDCAFIIGGERLYREALPLADRVYLTRVDQDTDFNEHTDEVARFPLYAMKWNDWNMVEIEKHDGFSFQVWEK
ncbi:MAG TPA: dihydrofolate reductase [Methylophilaceae bacterium]|nr:dihydrofolate reductase [Methylophilaceae bacterium]